MITLHTRALTASQKKFDYVYSAYLDLLPTTSAYSIVTPDGANIESAGGYACVIDTEVAPPTANYSVSADVKVRTIVSGNSAGIILRGSGTEKKAYYLQLYADGTLKLQRDGPWNSNLATASVPLTAGTIYRVKGVIDGDQISGYVDGVLKIGPITDAAITAAGYPGYVVWADSAGVSDSTGMAVSNLSLDTLDSPDASADGGTGTVTVTGTGGEATGQANASADGGTGTITVTGAGGEATGGTSGTNASADGGTGTISVTGTGGEATATATGSFTTDAMENNTGAGLLASVAVVWTWYKGAIGTAPTSTTHGTGTTNSSGVITATGLPAGAGFILVETADGGVYYHPGTIT